MIIVIIMIKSSDKNWNNAYRITKVLSNQDYLAVDEQDNYFIFSSALTNLTSKTSPEQSSHDVPPPQPYHFILLHKQIIYMNNFHYYVFQLGKSNVIWAKSIQAQLITKENYKFQLIKHAVNGLLKDVLWMKSDDIKMYLDIRNFWLINGKLHILLLKRQNVIRFSIKRSQNYRKKNMNNQTMFELIKNERKIMKQFALILWQIIHQKSYKQNSPKDIKTFINNFLYKVIHRQLSYEQMKDLICAEQQRIINNVRYHKKCKTKSTLLDSNRKVRVSTQPIANMLNNKSYLKMSKTVQSTNIMNTAQKNKQITRKSSVILDNDNIIKKRQHAHNMSKYRSHLLTSNINFVKDKLFKNQTRTNNYRKIFSTLNQQDEVMYKRWLTKHRSLQFDQKLEKQSLSAKEKYLNTVSVSKFEQSSQNLKEDLMRQRLIQKLKQFKEKRLNVLKQSRSILDQKRVNKSFTQNISQLIPFQMSLSIRTNSFYVPNLPINSIKFKNKQKIYLNKQLSKKQQQKKQLNSEKNQNAQLFEQIQSIKLVNIETKSSMKNNQETKDQINKLNNEKIKQNNNNLKRNKKIIVLNEINDEIQEIKFVKNQNIEKLKIKTEAPIIKKQEFIVNSQKDKEKVKITINHLKKQKEQKLQSIKNEPDFEQLQFAKKSKIQQSLNYFSTFLNILGDICIRSIRNKQKLNNFEWKKIIYLLYERFYYERLKFVKSLKAQIQLKIRNKQLNSQQWKAWLKTSHYTSYISRLQQQNLNISKTFNKFSQQLIKENKLQQKFIYYITNRQKLLYNAHPNIRTQLSKIIVISLCQNFDEIIEKKISNKDIICYLMDGLFGLKIVGELDNVLEPKQWVKFQHYREYQDSLKQVDEQLDMIYDVYFPQERSQDNAIRKK